VAIYQGKNMHRVVVTGAAGYIGRQTVLALLDAGHQVLGIDTVAVAAQEHYQHVQEDFSADTALTSIIAFQPHAVIHCAAESTVAPSLVDPAGYYEVNVVKTKHLIDIVRRALPATRFIFSSSAAVYGEPIMTPCHEVDPCDPINPYGETKLVIERLLAHYYRAYGFDYVAFRYFNVAGADRAGRAGPHYNGSHIMERALGAAQSQQTFELYGTDYPTPDGTCVRDYVHVEDVARAHVMALNLEIETGVYNLGTDHGCSNLEIVNAVQRVTGKTLVIVSAPKRPGDPAMLTASPTRWITATQGQWQPQSLDAMISTAWAWYQL
jgi:UDP-glucose 4-epimerase